MSVYATIFDLRRPGEEDEALAGLPIRVLRGEEARSQAEELGSPWVFRHSGVIPEAGHPRGARVELGAIPASVLDARRGVPEGEWREDAWLPWLRLAVGTGARLGEGDGAIVVLDAPQALAPRDSIDRWLSDVEGDEGRGRRWGGG